MDFRAVIFDVDGTLIDSNDAHAFAFVEAFASERRPVSFEAIRPLIGMGADKLVPTVSGLSIDGPLGKKIAERKKQIFFEKYLPRLKPFPKARELVEKMKQKGIELAIATSAEKDELKKLLKLDGVSYRGVARQRTKRGDRHLRRALGPPKSHINEGVSGLQHSYSKYG